MGLTLFMMQPLAVKMEFMIYYKYFYYRLYKLFLRISPSDIPEGKAFLSILLLSVMDIMMFYNILYLNNIELLPSSSLFAKTVIVLGVGLLGVLHYIIFIHKKRYLKIKSYFEEVNYKKFNAGLADMGFVLFCFFWLIALIICAAISRGLN